MRKHGIISETDNRKMMVPHAGQEQCDGIQPRKVVRQKPPASWHTRFILEQRERGQVQPHLLASTETIFEGAAALLGAALPQPTTKETWLGGMNFRWIVEPNRRFVVVDIHANGKMRIRQSSDKFLYLLDAGQLATALRELFAETEGEA